MNHPTLQKEPLFTPRFVLACAVHFTGAMAISFYILFPLFIRKLGGSEVDIGIYTGIMGAAAVGARFPIGRFLDTQGRWRVLAGAGLLHAVSWIGFVWIESLGAACLALVIAHGLAGGALFAAFFTYASDIVPVTRRSEGIGMFGVWGMLPNGLGPLLGEFLIGSYSFGAFFLAAAAFATLSLCMSLLLPETVVSTHAHGSEAPAREPFQYRRLLFLLVTTFMFGVVVNSVFTFLAPFAYTHGHGNVGSFFLTYSLAAVAVRVLSGRLPDRVGPWRVLIPALFVLGAGVLAIPHVDTRTLILVGALCGAGHGYSFPILNALTVEQVTPAQRGRAVSWFTAMFDLGTTLANPVLGAVAEWAGYTAMFTLAGIGMLATAGTTLYRRAVSAR